jgi:hypothetical protein
VVVAFVFGLGVWYAVQVRRRRKLRSGEREGYEFEVLRDEEGRSGGELYDAFGGGGGDGEMDGFLADDEDEEIRD